MKKILVVGGSGSLLNSIINFLPDNTIILGRKKSFLRPELKFIKFDLEKDNLDFILEKNNIDIILNVSSKVTSDISKLGFNLVSVKKIVNSAKKYNIRIIHISTLKINHELFIPIGNKYNIPYSQYGWSKKCAEEYLKNNYKNLSILRPGFIDSEYSKKYYKSLFMLDLDIFITKPNDLWKSIKNEFNKTDYSEKNVISGKDNLIKLSKRLTGRKFYIKIPKNFINIISKTPTKLFDYLN